MRDCANCFHRKPVLKEDGTWTAECEKWDCEFQSRENMIEKTKAMNNDLISREALRKEFHERIHYFNKSSWDEANALIDNAPTIKPCDNCDLYFKAMTKEEMKKGGAE